MKDLAILIPTLPARMPKFLPLLTELSRQIKEYSLEDHVQILYLGDTKEYTVGHKRNELLKLACARYVNFLDDDDRIARNYLKRLRQGCLSGKDCVTFCGEYRENSGTPMDFSISMLHRNNRTENGIIYRLPNHICPVKRDLAMKAMFTNKNYGEDADYSARLASLIKNEYHIKEKLYFYDYDSSNSQTNPNNKSNPYI